MNKNSKGIYTGEVKKGLLLRGLEDKQEMATQGILQAEEEACTQAPVQEKHQTGKRLISERKNLLR